jgi:hypothetical protein
LFIFVFLLSALFSAHAQESPYFVTYDHHMEEPGNLEIELSSTIGVPRSDQRAFFAPYMELEYGVTARWTTELYLEGQTTAGDSAVFTGWRLENRFQPLKREHIINPVLYLEYENLNEASKILKEIEGYADPFDPNSEASKTPAHELETKLILSSDVHDWNIAENFIVEKNLSRDEGFEFGYSAGFAHPLSTLASAKECHFCAENFILGAEIYGGLGSTEGFGFSNTAHYIAPALSWQVSDNSSIRFSPGFGLTHGSFPVLLRFGYSYEIRGFGSKVAQLFGGKP